MLEKIQETAAYLKSKMSTQPKTAIILGTGLGSLVHEITNKYEINYTEIPNFPISTVEGHNGKLIFGKLGDKDIMAMQGRFHFYEGYTMKEVTFPVRVMRELGIKTLFVSNAAGGMNPEFEIGDLMFITDHINFFPEHPLRGKNIEYGPRFPDMSEAYDRELISKANEIAKENYDACDALICTLAYININRYGLDKPTIVFNSKKETDNSIEYNYTTKIWKMQYNKTLILSK